MHRRDRFVLLTTFLFGFFCGFYLYLVGFSPNYSIDIESLKKADMVIIAEQYGGCEANGRCAAFRIEDDGSYRFAPETTTDAQTQTFIDGSVPDPLFARLLSELSTAEMIELSELVEPVSCASSVGDNDVLYTITIDNDEFELDTCGTRFNHDTELGQALVALWDFFESEMN